MSQSNVSLEMAKFLPPNFQDWTTYAFRHKHNPWGNNINVFQWDCRLFLQGTDMKSSLLHENEQCSLVCFTFTQIRKLLSSSRYISDGKFFLLGKNSDKKIIRKFFTFSLAIYDPKKKICYSVFGVVDFFRRSLDILKMIKTWWVGNKKISQKWFNINIIFIYLFCFWVVWNIYFISLLNINFNGRDFMLWFVRLSFAKIFF